MRWIGAMAGVLAAQAVGAVGAVGAAELELTIVGARDSGGRILVAVFDQAESFQTMQQDKRIAAAILPLDGTSTRLVLGGLRPGRYAASVVHDTNGNGKLDTNLIGLPTEGYGFSRDARGVMGPPSFEAAAFDLPPTGGKQTITLGY
jgi:uncharacterized protein (DUF2141 family)